MAGPKPSSPLVAPSRSHRFFDRYSRVLRRALTLAGLLACGAATASNPIVPGWYADPEIRVFGGR